MIIMEKDEFDQMLDEAEKQFFKPSQVEKKRLNNPNSIDDLLNTVYDELSVDNDDDDSLQQTEQLYDKEDINNNNNNKCCPVLLTGSNTPIGLSSRKNPRSCNRMICTSCDFHVIWFDEYYWDDSCDYYFLRNNVPNFEKLKEKLIKSKGYRSYACQCSCKSVNEITPLPNRTIKWVCTRH